MAHYGDPPPRIEGTIELERVRLRGAYDAQGRYWGLGPPLFLGHVEGGGAFAIRASSLTAAKAKLRAKYPGVKFRGEKGRARAVGPRRTPRRAARSASKKACPCWKQAVLAMRRVDGGSTASHATVLRLSKKIAQKQGRSQAAVLEQLAAEAKRAGAVTRSASRRPAGRARARAAAPSKPKRVRKWSGKVTRTAKYHTPPGLFQQDGRTIAIRLVQDSKTEKQALARVTFYQNRAGRNLTAADRHRLGVAKAEIRHMFQQAGGR